MERRPRPLRQHVRTKGYVRAPEECFWPYVSPEPNTGCWLWTGYANEDGYGRIWYRGKPQGAHRFAWRMDHGDVPKGLCVMHRCDNRLCVNPDHLAIGTQRDNMSDCSRKGRTGKRHGTQRWKVDPAAEAAIVSMAREGVPRAAIARCFDLHPMHVTRVLARNGAARGHLLAPAIVEQMRVLYFEGAPRREIARALGVHRHTVTHVSRREGWPRRNIGSLGKAKRHRPLSLSPKVEDV